MDFEQVVEGSHKLATNMSKATESSDSFVSIFKNATVAAAGIELIRGTIVKIVEQSGAWQRVSAALNRENLTRLSLVQRDMELTNLRHELERKRSASAGRDLELVDLQLLQVRDQLENLNRQRLVAAELERLSSKQLVFMGMMVTAGTTMWVNARQFNQSLIEANSSWQHRDKLIRDTLVSQAQLGISFDDLTKSAAALVHYGMDTADTFETNLRLVAQMEQGLGVSVGESARLATIVERQIKGSFESVSHTIAQIVDDTALAGDEAARLATNIATALGRLRPGMSAATLPDVVRLVGRYEGALKEVGGQSGAFQQLLTQLTTPEGLVGAGALGVNPEFLATTQGVEHVMQRFAKYGEMLVGQSQGWERQMRLQALAQIFNVTTDQANQMLIAIKRTQTEQMGQISTQERWKQQLNATNSGIQRLGNSLMGLLQGAMYPVVFVVGALANRLADGVEWLLKTKEAVYVIGGVLLAGTVLVTASMWGLVRALAAVALSSTAAQAALGRTAVASGASVLASLAPTGKFMSLFGRWGRLMSNVIMPPSNPAAAFNWVNQLPGMISRSLAAAPTAGAGWLRPFMMAVRGIGTIFSSSLLLWATPLVFAGTMLTKIYNVNKQAREDNLAAQKIILSKQEAWESGKRARLYAAARYGEPEDVAKVYQALATAAGGMFQEIQDPTARKKEQQKWLDEQLASAEADIAKAMTTRTMFTPLIERTPEELRRSDDMKKVNDKLLKVNEDQKAILEKRQRDAIEARQEEAQERAKLRPWQPSFYWDFYSRIGSGE